jgi:ABC-2 type transport system ATP-binding protein
VYARAAGIPRRRVDEVLGLVGLADVAGRKVGGFSLGMRQRLGLATALLGDPGVLVLDEPANGLDPEGIRWMRTLLQAFAAEGRTVLVSSHLLAEIQQTADRLLILAHGRLVFDGNIEDLADASEYATTVDAPDRDALAAAVTAAGHEFVVLRTGLTVRGAEPVEIGAIAQAAGVPLSSLQRRGPALEDIFLALVDGSRVHGVVSPAAPPAAAAPPVVTEDDPDDASDAAEPSAEPAAESPADPAPDAPEASESGENR